MPQPSSPHAEHRNTPSDRQAFHHPRTSMGAGHWIKTAGILAPLVIGELVKDPDQRWRWIRISSVATALVSEGMWAHRLQKERRECEERERQ
jgi:hypothetical protein